MKRENDLAQENHKTLDVAQVQMQSDMEELTEEELKQVIGGTNINIGYLIQIIRSHQQTGENTIWLM